MHDMENNNTFNRAFLSSGKNLILSDNVIVHHPSIEDIYNLGNGIDCEDIYWNYVNIILSDPYTHMVELDDMGLNYLTQTPFDVFTLKWKLAKKIYGDNRELFDKLHFSPLKNIKNALIFFLGEHEFDIAVNADGETFLVDLYNKNFIMNKEQFNLMSKFIMSINCIDTSYQIVPANESARKILIEDQRDEINRRKKYKKQNEDIDYIGTAIDIVACLSGSVNYLNIDQYKIYQLLKSVKFKIKKDNYDHLITGIYTGNIDISKINKNELTWIV